MKPCFLMIVVIFFASTCFAKGDIAKSGEGIRADQPFILLDNGYFYATKDRKVVPPERIRPATEAKRIREQVITRLNRKRYWESGSPPATDLVMRHHARIKELKSRIEFYRALRRENWSRQGSFEKNRTPASGG
jgi:hypothetical protein